MGKNKMSMAKKGEARQRITLKCTVCGEENYRTEKNKRTTADRIELNKFCAKCRQVTPHKEEK